MAMNTKEMMEAANKAAIVDRVAKFEVGLIQSITLQANMHGQGPDGRQATVALRVEPGDPRFGPLEALLKSEATAQKTAAETDLVAAGVTIAVDQAELDAHAAASAAAKAEYDQLVERNRQKRILAEALAADAAKKAKAPV